MGKFKYINGNYLVTLDNITGSKSFRTLKAGDDFIPDFPDSIDLKITNKCSEGCPWCHEDSKNNDSRVIDLQTLKSVLGELKDLPIEVAIGGGNVLECPELFNILNWMNLTKLQPRLTINLKSINTVLINNSQYVLSQLKNKCGGFGISIDNSTMVIDKIPSSLVTFKNTCGRTPIVVHVIAGILPITKIKILLAEFNVLILGYKSVGRGFNFQNPISEEWIMELKRLIYSMRSDNIEYKKLSFDNLALEQLDIKSSVLSDEWERFYMGNDFSHSMYIDAIDGVYAPTSRSPQDERVDWKSTSLRNYFNSYKNNH